MSHTRNRASQQPQQNRFQNYSGNRQMMNRNRGEAEHSGQNRNMGSRGQRNENTGSQNYPGQDFSEQERYGGQGDGGSQGEYGRQGGYRQTNYARNMQDENDYSYGGEFRDDNQYMPNQRSQEFSNRGWSGSESGYGEESGRSQWGGGNYQENYGYREGGMGGGNQSGSWQGTSNISRFTSRGPQRSGSSLWNREGMNYGEGQSSSSEQRQSHAGRGPQGYRRSDERITEDINEQLTQDADVDASGISVEVKSGEVVLKGTVSDRESKRRAEEIAESCSGVKDVQNQLRIKKEDSGDSENESRRNNRQEEKHSKAS